MPGHLFFTEILKSTFLYQISTTLSQHQVPKLRVKMKIIMSVKAIIALIVVVITYHHQHHS